MKSVKKLLGIFTIMLLIGGGVLNLVSCSDDDDDDDVKYSISASETSVTLKPGADKTLTVTTNGTMVKPEAVEGLTVEISNPAKTIKITASDSITEKTDKTVTVKLSEDKSKSVTIAVTVDPNAETTYDKMNLTLNFAENIGASSVTVKYWDSGENDPADDIVGEVTADVTNNTATVELSEQYKGSWGYKISLIVKDSSDNEVKVQVDGNAYFEYKKDETVTLSVIKYVATTKDMTINFSNLGTVVVGTVKYGSSDTDTSLQTTANMVINGTSATVEISSDYCNGDNYFYIAEIKLYLDADKATEITDFDIAYSDGTASTAWQAFANIAKVTLSPKTTSKTFTIKFSGFTIAGGSVTGLKVSNTWYETITEWVDGTTLTPTVTVAEDGTKATFEIAAADLTADKEFYVDWTSAVIKDKDGKEITISSGNTNAKEEGTWYSYSEVDETKWSVTFVVDGDEYTQLGDPIAVSDASTIKNIVDASKFADLNLTKVKVVVSNLSETDSLWITLATDGKWGNSVEKMQEKGTVTWADSDVISALQVNGLWIQTNGECTVTVSYVAEADKTPGAFTVTAGTATATTIPLTWTASSDATYYKVQYKATSDSDEYTTVSVAAASEDNGYTISGLTASTSYTVKVTAYSGKTGTAGMGSSNNNELTVTTPVVAATEEGTVSKNSISVPTNWERVKVFGENDTTFTDYANKTVTQIKIVLTGSTNKVCSYTAASDAWIGDFESNTSYTVTTTDKDTIAKILAGDLYLNAESQETVTLAFTITYETESSSD